MGRVNIKVPNPEETDAAEIEELELESYTYEPPSLVKIPDELAAYLRRTGEVARWMRFKVRQEEDTKNIADAIQEGYRFVTQEDLGKANSTYFFDVLSNERYGSDMITRGDLVLMAIKKGKLKAREEYYAKKAHDLETAVRRQLRSDVPGVIDESKFSSSVPQVRFDN